jgi:hypothetical protein
MVPVGFLGDLDFLHTCLHQLGRKYVKLRGQLAAA